MLFEIVKTNSTIITKTTENSGSSGDTTTDQMIPIIIILLLPTFTFSLDLDLCNVELGLFSESSEIYNSESCAQLQMLK